MSIRARLLVTYLALTALGMSVLAGYNLWAFHSYYLNTARADLSARATAVGESIADSLEKNDLSRTKKVVDRYAIHDKINIRIFSPDGELIASSTPEPGAEDRDWSTDPAIAAGLRGESYSGILDVPDSDFDELYEVRPLVRSGELIGVLRMSFLLVQFQRQFTETVHTVAVVVLLAFGICAALSVALARSIAEPIQRMCQFASRVGRGRFEERMEVRRRDELGRLSSELNRMAESLASTEEQRRVFLANVSHELRTPVSNVHVTLEALESGADEEPEVRQRFIRTCLDETARLSRLVQDLLDLGRLEAGVEPLHLSPFPLRGLIGRCQRAFETRMLARGLRVVTEVPDAEIFGDHERLQQALLNVLDNAFKYAPPESTVSVTGRQDGESIVLEVRDRGPGIRQGDLPHVFEQFYTGDRSRKRGGTGLGLAIARRIVEQHGGAISVTSVEGEGATVTIRLPLRAGEPSKGEGGRGKGEGAEGGLRKADCGSRPLNPKRGRQKAEGGLRK